MNQDEQMKRDVKEHERRVKESEAAAEKHKELEAEKKGFEEGMEAYTGHKERRGSNYDRRIKSRDRRRRVLGRRFDNRRSDKTLKVGINTTNEEINRHLEEHASGRQPREAQEDHPRYVKGADKSVKEGIRELSRRLLEESKKKMAEAMFFHTPEVVALMAKAEVEHFTKHSGVTDVLKGSPPRARCDNCLFYFTRADKQDYGDCCYNAKTVSGWPTTLPSDWCGQYQAHRQKDQPQRCGDCLFYAPTVFGVTSSGAPLPTTLGDCQRQAPMLNGSVVFPVVWPATHQLDGCSKHKRKVE